jgi:hypothetical protein
MTKVKIWWTAEEITKFIPDFAERVAAYTATLPVKPKAVKPVSEATALKQRVAELEAKLASTEPQALVVSTKEPTKKPRRRARKA